MTAIISITGIAKHVQSVGAKFVAVNHWMKLIPVCLRSGLVMVSHYAIIALTKSCKLCRVENVFIQYRNPVMAGKKTNKNLPHAFRNDKKSKQHEASAK